LSCLVLSSLVLSFLFFSCLVFSCLVLSCITWTLTHPYPTRVNPDPNPNILGSSPTLTQSKVQPYLSANPNPYPHPNRSPYPHQQSHAKSSQAKV
jgi:hypothetical protein